MGWEQVFGSEEMFSEDEAVSQVILLTYEEGDWQVFGSATGGMGTGVASGPCWATSWAG